MALEVEQGETVGLVGEIGYGKSTLARCVVRLVQADNGTILFDGADLLGVRGATLHRVRSRVQMIFQDPRSLNASFSIGRTVAEPLRLSGEHDRGIVRETVAQALQPEHLPASFAHRRPGQLSGGQKQRAGIAMAIITDPDLLVLDEPTSSLDQPVRAGIASLLRRLQEQAGTTYVPLPRDLSTVRKLCGRVYTMYGGHIVEHGPTEAVYGETAHPRTRALIAAIPLPDPAQHKADWGRGGGAELGVRDVGTLERVGDDHYVAATR